MRSPPLSSLQAHRLQIARPQILDHRQTGVEVGRQVESVQTLQVAHEVFFELAEANTRLARDAPGGKRGPG